MYKIYIIAGESSGDFIGAQLIKALRAQFKNNVIIKCVGGDLMNAQADDLLFHCRHISLMGFVEIIPHIFQIKKRLRATIDDIVDFKPHVVVTIDSSGFCSRVIEGVKKKTGLLNKPTFIHYVAPQVWAWRAYRAKKWAQRVDHLLCLFNFEPAYFECHGLKTTWVGHPLIELSWQNEPRKSDTPLLCLLPGSRFGEIKRHLAIFKGVADNFPNYTIVIPTFPHFEAMIKEICPQATLVTKPDLKHQIMMKSHIALATSGTVALELALARTPCVVAYRTSTFSAFIVRQLIKTIWVSLPNILIKKGIIPECLQEDCTIGYLTQKLQQESLHTKQDADFFERVRTCLSNTTVDSSTPSYKAAHIIYTYCQS